jgi:hypothetical protein
MTHEAGPDHHGATARVERGSSPRFVLHAEGEVTLPSMRGALSALERLRVDHGAVDALVIDALDVSRFGRGAVLELARWIPRHASWVRRVVVLSHSTQLRTSIVALAACAPSITIVSETARDRVDISARLPLLARAG